MSGVTSYAGCYRSFTAIYVFTYDETSLMMRVSDVAGKILGRFTKSYNIATHPLSAPGAKEGAIALLPRFHEEEIGYGELLLAAITQAQGVPASFERMLRPQDLKKGKELVEKGKYHEGLRYCMNAFKHGARWQHFLKQDKPTKAKLLCLYLAEYFFTQGEKSLIQKVVASYHRQISPENRPYAYLTHEGLALMGWLLKQEEVEVLPPALYKHALQRHPEQFSFYRHLAHSLTDPGERRHVLCKGAEQALQVKDYAEAIALAQEALQVPSVEVEAYFPALILLWLAKAKLAGSHGGEAIWFRLESKCHTTTLDKDDQQFLLMNLVRSYCEMDVIEQAHSIFKGTVKQFPSLAYRKNLCEFLVQWELGKPYFGPAKWHRYAKGIEEPNLMLPCDMSAKLEALGAWQGRYALIYCPCISLAWFKKQVAIECDSDLWEALKPMEQTEPGWFLITKNLIQGSRNQTKEAQCQLLEKAKATMPTVLEVVICYWVAQVQQAPLPYHSTVEGELCYTRCLPFNGNEVFVCGHEDRIQILSAAGCLPDEDFGVGGCWHMK